MKDDVRSRYDKGDRYDPGRRRDVRRTRLPEGIDYWFFDVRPVAPEENVAGPPPPSPAR